MNVTVGELIGNFILIAGSFILLLVLIKNLRGLILQVFLKNELKRLLLMVLNKLVKQRLCSKARR